MRKYVTMRAEAEAKLRKESIETRRNPLPPVDSSTEQKPKGFPVPDGVDGVEGISQKPSLQLPTGSF